MSSSQHHVLKVYPTATAFAPEALQGRTVILIDTLRATSTIITALANGCPEVIPASNPAEAKATARKWPPHQVLLAGEIQGKRLPEFSLGNSPREFTPGQVGGKRVILTTTNGTKAIERCLQGACLFIGSFLNVKAVTRQAFSLGPGVTIVCAGTRGQFSLEDTLTAGRMVDLGLKTFPALALDDLALASHHLYLTHAHRISSLLKTTAHGQLLTELGYEEDIDFCCQEDRFDAVPVYQKGALRLM